MPNSPTIFIGSSGESLRIAEALQSSLGELAQVSVWNQGIFGLSGFTLEHLVSATERFDFAVFVFAADDTVMLRGKRFLVARDNVVFELGLFAGRLGYKRTYLVVQECKGKLHLPSDLQGLTVASFRWPHKTKFKNAPLETIRSAIGPVASQIRDAIRKELTGKPSKTASKSTTIPDVAGEWKYCCSSDDSTYAHGGCCTIKVDRTEYGITFRLSGRRIWSARRNGAKWTYQRLPNPFTWQNTWGAITGEDTLRYQYSICVDGIETPVMRGLQSLSARAKPS